LEVENITTEGLYQLVTTVILWYLDNTMTLAVCISCIAIIWYYLCLWTCSRSVWGRSWEWRLKSP